MLAEGYFYVEDKEVPSAKDSLDQQISKLRADLEYFLEHGDESIFERYPGAEIEIQVKVHCALLHTMLLAL